MQKLKTLVDLEGAIAENVFSTSHLYWLCIHNSSKIFQKVLKKIKKSCLTFVKIS